MLGTPNRGSFAIPLTLTGAEKAASGCSPRPTSTTRSTSFSRSSARSRASTRCCRRRSSTSATTTSSSSTLETWGDAPVRAPLLDTGAVVHRESSTPVIDPDASSLRRRLRPARHPWRSASTSRARSPTGRRPTATGASRTRSACSRASRPTGSTRSTGTSPRTARVLDAITDLLQRGATSVLPTTKPSRAAPSRGVRRGWVERGRARARRARDRSDPRPARRAAAAARPSSPVRRRSGSSNLTLGDYLGTARGGSVEPAAEGGPPAVAREPRQLIGRPSRSSGATSRRSTRATSTRVGHYQGVAAAARRARARPARVRSSALTSASPTRGGS